MFKREIQVKVAKPSKNTVQEPAAPKSTDARTYQIIDLVSARLVRLGSAALMTVVFVKTCDVAKTLIENAPTK